MKFKEYAYKYLKFGKSEWKNSTFDKNQGIVANRLNFFFDYDLTDIKPSVIKEWLSAIDDVGSKSKKHYISSLNSILTLALQDEMIDKNPLIHLRAVKSRTPDIEPFTKDEVRSILKEAKFYNKNFIMFLYLGFYTGMRTGEILALKFKDIDMKNKTISVKSSRSRFGESTPKTLGSIRIIPILDELLPVIARSFYSYDFISCDYVLTTQYNLPYRDTYIFQGYWKQILKKLNLKYRRPYVMRHTFATNMLLDNHVTPLELASLLGHSSPKMIYDVYVRYVNKNLKSFDRSIKVY